MATPERFTEPAVLTSWKEVASYLGKGVRTVQRWEKHDGLPVRRLAGTSKIVVKREDLDRWLNAQPVQSQRMPIAAVDFEVLRSGMLRSKSLRERHFELRQSLHVEMARLVEECRRMMSTCTPPREKS